MAFPDIPITEVALRSHHPTRITETLNGIEERSSLGAQYFSINVVFENLEKINQRKLMAFIDEQSGPLEPFDFPLPDYIGDSTGDYTGSITAASGAAGDTQCNITHTGNTGDYILRAGDLVQFSTHKKLYVVTADVIGSSSQIETLYFSPPARAAISGGTVVHKDLTMYVRFGEDTQEFEIDPSQFPTYEIEFKENLT